MAFCLLDSGSCVIYRSSIECINNARQTRLVDTASLAGCRLLMIKASLFEVRRAKRASSIVGKAAVLDRNAEESVELVIAVLVMKGGDTVSIEGDIVEYTGGSS